MDRELELMQELEGKEKSFKHQIIFFNVNLFGFLYSSRRQIIPPFYQKLRQTLISNITRTNTLPLLVITDTTYKITNRIGDELLFFGQKNNITQKVGILIAKFVAQNYFKKLKIRT